MVIAELDSELSVQLLQITQLFLWKLIARMNQQLRFDREALDDSPSDHALAGKVLTREHEPVGLPRRNAIAPLIKPHGVHIKLAPLGIVQHKGCRSLNPVRVYVPTVLGPQLSEPPTVSLQESMHSDNIIQQHDDVEIMMRAGLPSEQSVNPPATCQPDLNAAIQETLVDAGYIFSADHQVSPNVGRRPS
jgi:hypothetical protein